MLMRDAVYATDTCEVEVSLGPKPDDVCVGYELWGIEREQRGLVVLKGGGTGDGELHVDPWFENVGLSICTRSK
jgi:hypothetical protein